MFIRLATVVDVMQLFWWKSRKSKFSLLAEATRICHFKTNEQFFILVLFKKAFIVLSNFVQVQTSEQTFFNLLILGKSRIPPTTGG